jgi:hypothetical protein
VCARERDCGLMVMGVGDKGILTASGGGGSIWKFLVDTWRKSICFCGRNSVG